MFGSDADPPSEPRSQVLSSLRGRAVLSCAWTSGDQLSDGELSFPGGAVSLPPVASSAVQTRREN